MKHARAHVGFPCSPFRGRLGPDGSLLRCYVCGGTAAISADDSFDPVADRDGWPALACLATPGCPGLLVPEMLN